VESSWRWPRKYAWRMASSESGVSKAKEEVVRNKRAAKAEAIEREGKSIGENLLFIGWLREVDGYMKR
jgi:hypothetical protein